jgi:ABC-2 type transport system permease protein
MKALAIALKDVRRTLRSPVALAMMLGAPLLLTFLLGSAFGGAGGFTVPATKLVVVDLDAPAAGGAAAAASGGGQATSEGAAVVAALTSKDLAKLLEVTTVATEAEARAQVDQGKAAVAVIVPKGFSAAMQSQQAATATITLYKDPSLTLGPTIVRSILQSLADAFNGARAAAAVTVQLAVAQGVVDQATLQQAAGGAAQSFAASFQATPPISLEQRAPQASGATMNNTTNVMFQVLTGMMVFFMFIAAANGARSILDEDEAGTLQRMFTTPTPRAVILGGKFLSVFLTVLVQATVLLAAGRLLFNIQWGSFGTVVVLDVVGSMVATGLALFLLSFSKTPAQAGAITSGVMVLLGLLGGNFIGTGDLGGWFDIVRRLTPNGWLLIAWGQNINGGSTASLVLPVVVCLGFAAATFAAGSVVLSRRYR